MSMTILITGVAGFIGANLACDLIRSSGAVNIIGIDCMNDYCDVSIKEYHRAQIERLAAENANCAWVFIKGDIADKSMIDDIFETYKPTVVVNLAAQAGGYGIPLPIQMHISNLIL